MADLSALPGLRSWPNMPPEWFRFFRDLATQPTTSGDVDLSGLLPNTTQIIGQQSVRVDGTLAGGFVFVLLEGDVTNPAETHYYGTNALGAKGWHAFPENEGGVLPLVTGEVPPVLVYLDDGSLVYSGV